MKLDASHLGGGVQLHLLTSGNNNLNLCPTLIPQSTTPNGKLLSSLRLTYAFIEDHANTM